MWCSKRQAVAVITFTVAVSGCGGGDGNGGSGSTPPEDGAQTRETYIAAVDPICDRFEGTSDDARSRLQEAQEGNDVDAAAAAYRDAAQKYEDFGDELAEVEPPPGDEAPDQIADGIRATSDLLRREADAVEQRDINAARAIAEEINKNTERLEGLAQGYGLSCPGGSKE